MYKSILTTALLLSLATPALSTPCQELNESLSKMEPGIRIDEITTFITAGCKDNTAYFVYKVDNGIVATIFSDNPEEADKVVTETVCKNPKFKILAEFGIKVQAEYYTEDQQLLAVARCGISI